MKIPFINKPSIAFWQNLSLSLILFALLLLMLLMPEGWISGWWYKKNIIFIFSVFTAALIQVFIKKDTLVFNKVDLLFVGFILWNFISYFWATNPSLIWDKSFVWVLLYALYKTISSINIYKINFKIWINILLLVLVFNNLVLGWFYFEISSQGETLGFNYANVLQIQKYLTYNPNYIASLLLMTFPLYVLLWHYRTKWKFLILILALFHLLFLFGLNCRGALLAVFIQLIILSIVNIKKIRKFIWVFPVFIVLFISINFLITDKEHFYEQYNPLKEVHFGRNERLKIWESSIKIWQENIFTGKGVGNWIIESTKYSQSIRFGYDSDPYYQHPHNLYFHILSELGLTGLLLYLLLILYFLFLYLKKIKTSREQPIYLTLLLILIGYIVISSFFGVVYAEKYYPIFHQAFLFSSLAIGAALHQNKTDNKPYLNIFKILVVILTGCYFCYFQFRQNKQREQNRLIHLKNNKKYNKALQTFDGLYDPVFYTMFQKSNRNISLKTHKALILWQQNKKEEAINTMFDAVEDQPYYHINWFHFGNMYNGIQDYSNAKICYENVYHLKDNFVEAQIKLVEIHLAQNDMLEAEKWYDLTNAKVNRFLKKYRKAEKKGEKFHPTLFNKFNTYRKRLRELEMKFK